jgi:hypothetical protein
VALHDTDLETKTIMFVEDSEEGGGTLVFEDEVQAGDFVFPAPRTNRSLEDTWRIEPDQLKCRRKANGELWKLGQGKIKNSELYVCKLISSHCKFEIGAVHFR